MKHYINQSQYIPKAIGVKEYSYEEEINLPSRNTMEDYYFIKDNILEDGNQSILFGILDGHGGQQVAQYVSINFPKIFVSFYKQHSKNIPNLLLQCFHKIDLDIKNNCNSDEVGCTASIGFMRLEGAKRVLYFANLGDSRAFLFEDKPVPLTVDHKPTKETEKARILQCQGVVLMERLNGVLAVSRAFGDFAFKECGLSSVPDQLRIELRQTHKWLIVASDGLWDVVKEDEINEFIKYKETADEVTKFLLKLALKRESKDNISILCLKIQI